jgi:oligopeptide transport system substrate-binding protein
MKRNRLNPNMPTARFILSRLFFCLSLVLLSKNILAEPLRRGLGPEPDSLHIHQAQGLTAINLLRDLREGLVTFDSQGRVAPGVASDWVISNQGRQYVFSLRPEARWSNGDKVSAEDFVRSWRLALDPASAAVTGGLLKDIKNAQDVMQGKLPPQELGIEARKDGKLVVNLEKAAPWLPEILAHPVSYPLHPNLGNDIHQDPVNGAYKLDEWTPRSKIRLSRNSMFHSASDVVMETIEYFPIEEPATELARYRAGELDITETIPAGRYKWLRDHHAEDLRISPYMGSFWLGINLNHSVLGGSTDLRLALALAIDRETLVRVALGAGEITGWGLVPPGIAGYEPQHIAMAGASQVEREQEARRLLAASGFDNNRMPVLEIRYNTSGLHRRVAVTVSAMWKQVLGISSELINEEWKVFVNNRRLGVNTEIFRGGWIADYSDPSSFLNLFISGDELNSTFYSDTTFDKLMDQASFASGGERMSLLQKAERRLLANVPIIPLYYYVSRHLVRPGVNGFMDNANDIHLSRYLSKDNL